MKKLLHTTWIALLISTVVFAQKGTPPGQQIAPSQTTVIVMAAHSNSIILLSPAEGKVIGTEDASKPLIFRWTAVSPKPKAAVTYRLKVWQLMQGQSAAVAMRSNQPVVTKEVENITQTAIGGLYTGPCKPPYMCEFVWAVEELNSDGVIIGNSYAVNSSFKFEVENVAVKNTKYGNPANPGSYGMSTGKSLNTNGEPINGVDVKLGVKSTSKQGDPVNGVDVKLGVKSTSKVDKELDKGPYSASKNNSCMNPCCSENAVWIDREDENTGVKSTKGAQSISAALYLPVDKIVYNANRTIEGGMIKTEKGESVFVKVLVSGSKSLSGGYVVLKTETGVPVIAKVVVAGSNNLSPGVK